MHGEQHCPLRRSAGRLEQHISIELLLWVPAMGVCLLPATGCCTSGASPKILLLATMHRDTRWMRAFGGVLAKVHSRWCIRETASRWRNVDTHTLQCVMLCTPHIKAPERCSR